MNESEQWNMYFTAILLFFTWYTVIKDNSVYVYLNVGIPALILTAITMLIISLFVKRKKA